MWDHSSVYPLSCPCPPPLRQSQIGIVPSGERTVDAFALVPPPSAGLGSVPFACRLGEPGSRLLRVPGRTSHAFVRRTELGSIRVSQRYFQAFWGFSWVISWERPCGSSWKTRSVFQGAVGAFCASTAPSASTGPVRGRQDGSQGGEPGVMSNWTAASSDCGRDDVHIRTADLYRPNARFTPERQRYQVLTPFGKLGYSPELVSGGLGSWRGSHVEALDEGGQARLELLGISQDTKAGVAQRPNVVRLTRAIDHSRCKRQV